MKKHPCIGCDYEFVSKFCDRCEKCEAKLEYLRQHQNAYCQNSDYGNHTELRVIYPST